LWQLQSRRSDGLLICSFFWYTGDVIHKWRIMKAETYSEALAHAWRITWRHKRLWGLGLLAAFIGSAGSIEFVTKFYSAALGERGAGILTKIQSFSSFSFNFQGETVLLWVTAFALIALGLAIVAFFVAVFVSAQGGLVYAVEEAEHAEKLDVTELFHHGRKRLGRLLILNIAKWAIVSLLLYLTWLGAGFLRSGTEALWKPAVFLVLSVVVLVVGLTVVFLTLYAVCYVSLHNKSLKEAVLDAWALFIDHWLVSLEMAIIMFAIGFLFGLAAVVGLLLLSTPVFLSLIIAAMSSNPGILLGGMSIGFIALFVWVLWLAAVYTTFAMSAWTVLFMQMSRHGFSSKMLHFLRLHLTRKHA